jgi:hypothetical protein
MYSYPKSYKFHIVKIPAVGTVPAASYTFSRCGWSTAWDRAISRYTCHLRDHGVTPIHALPVGTVLESFTKEVLLVDLATV